MFIRKVAKDYASRKYSLNLSMYDTKTYPIGHVFDEEKSVRWNREHLNEVNLNAAREECRLRNDRDALEESLKLDCVNAIMQDNGLTHAQAVVVYMYCYDKYHSNMSTMFEQLEDMASFAESILKAEGTDY